MTLARCHDLIARTGVLAVAAIALLVLDSIVFGLAVEAASGR